MIDKISLQLILKDWNLLWGNIKYPSSIPREGKTHLLRNFDRNHALILTGVRRSGKSTLMRQLIEELTHQYDASQFLFVNFEDPRFAQDLKFPLLV